MSTSALQSRTQPPVRAALIGSLGFLFFAASLLGLEGSGSVLVKHFVLPISILTGCASQGDCCRRSEYSEFIDFSLLPVLHLLSPGKT